MFPIVARSVTESAAAPSPKNSTNFPTTFCLRSISVTENEIGRGDTFLQGASEMDADDLRREKVDRLAEHARFGLDAANPQPTTPSPLIMVVCESVPTRVSG